MESVGHFMCALASSSLWLTGSGLVLWLCLRSRLQLSPGTIAASSMLIVLQGWMWIGIPVRLDIPAQLGATWIVSQPASTRLQQLAGVVPVLQVTEFGAAQSQSSLRLDGSRPIDDGPPVDAGQPTAANSMPSLLLLAIVAAGAVWMAGIVLLLCRSICDFVALSRMVQTLPRAKLAWQMELLSLCERQALRSPPALKCGNVASPMLVQTWRAACIVVPARLWESCTTDQRKSILLHELAHYRRGDVWRQLALRLLVLPHWFNPVAWWVVRQFEAASESTCDALACDGDPRVAISYAKILLVLNETMRNERAGLHFAQALAISGGSLSERIRRVLHPEFHKESQVSRFMIVSAMIVLTGLATVQIQAAEPLAKEEPDKAPGVILRRRTITEEYEKVEPASAPAVSLLANGGFEEVAASNDPQSWSATRIPQTAGHCVLASSSVAHSGQRSVVVEIGDGHPGTPIHYNWTAEAKGWQVGETYELSGWIKTENAKGPGFLMAQCWSEDGKRAVGYSQSPCEVRGTADWTRVSTLLRVPAGTGSVRIRAGLTSQDNQGAKAWIDDLALVKTSSSARKSSKHETAKTKSAPSPFASLLANGSFEEARENSSDPAAWFGTRIPQTAGHFVLASSPVAHSGSRSVVVEIGESHPDRRVAYNWIADANGWQAGETYELSGWIKTENANSPAFIMAQFWDDAGTNKKMIGGATTEKSSPVTGTTDWTRVSTRLKVPEGTAVVRIRAGMPSEGNAGAKAWLDDLSLVKVAAN